MNLEQNNLDAQISLMKDIISNNGNIMYHIIEKSKELMKILRGLKADDSKAVKDRTYSFTNQQFEDMLEIVANLADESKHNKLGVLAESAVCENNIKKEILSLLQKN